MKCARFRRLMHELAKEEVAPQDVASREAECREHVSGCDECAEFLELAERLSCRELVDFLDDYLEGKLEPSRAELFESHLGICEDCTNYLASYSWAKAAGARALADHEERWERPPEDLVRAILTARERPDEPE